MSEIMETVKVQPWGKGQGDFVEINKKDFDNAPAGKYKLYTGTVPNGPPPPAAASTKVPQDGLNFANKAAREAAIASGLDFSKVKGTGKKGAITAADVEAAIEATKPKINFASDEAGELAAEIGLDETEIAAITGTGEQGAITVDDIQKFVDERGKDND